MTRSSALVAALVLGVLALLATVPASAQSAADSPAAGATAPPADSSPQPTAAPGPAPTLHPTATPDDLPPATVDAPLDEPAPPLTDPVSEAPVAEDPVEAEDEGGGAAGLAGDGVEFGDPSAVPGVVEEILAYDEEAFSTVDLVTELLGREASPANRNLAHYELGASVDLVDRAFVTIARFFFTTGVWLFTVAGWVLRLALRFDLGHLLSGDVSTLSRSYGQLIRGGDSGIPLVELMLLIAIAHAGWQLFRHRGQAALAEVLVAVAIALVGAGLLTNADTAACRGLSVMNDLTVGMMALGSPGGDPDQPQADFCAGGVPTQTQYDRALDSAFDTFVHQPFMLLQWGSVPQRACAQVADMLVAQRAWDNIDEPREWMDEAGCPNMALFNARMSATRVMASGAYMMVTGAFGAAIVLTAGTLLIAQVAGALLILAMPFAVVAGIAPGAGRELLARWFHSLLKVTVLFMGAGFFLSLLLTTVSTVLRRENSAPIVVRMVMAVVVAWALVLLRGRIFRSMRFAAKGISQRAAGPGADVGPQGRGPAAVVGSAAARTAATLADVHMGAAAVRAGVMAAGSAAKGLKEGLTPASVHRGSRLRRMNQVAQQDGASGAPAGQQVSP